MYIYGIIVDYEEIPFVTELCRCFTARRDRADSPATDADTAKRYADTGSTNAERKQLHPG